MPDRRDLLAAALARFELGAGALADFARGAAAAVVKSAEEDYDTDEAADVAASAALVSEAVAARCVPLLREVLAACFEGRLPAMADARAPPPLRLGADLARAGVFVAGASDGCLEGQFVVGSRTADDVAAALDATGLGFVVHFSTGAWCADGGLAGEGHLDSDAFLAAHGRAHPRNVRPSSDEFLLLDRDDVVATFALWAPEQR